MCKDDKRGSVEDRISAELTHGGERIMRGGAYRFLCVSLIGLGSVVSGYLLIRTFKLMVDRSPDSIDMCATVFGAGCDATLLSPMSWQLGIPLAGWGLVFYGALACLLVLAWALGEAFEREAVVGALLVAIAGAAGSIVLIVLMVTGRAPICPLCIAVHAINVALVPALWGLSGRNTNKLFGSLRAGVKYITGSEAAQPARARWAVVGFLTTALVAMVLFQWVLVQSERRSHPIATTLDPEKLWADHVATPHEDISVDSDDPRLGPVDVPVQLVVFSDFQCPWCQSLADEIYHLIDSFPDNLAVIFKHYPLGTECNDAVARDTHPRACAAARAGEAARLQGRFWPFHDGLFATELDASEATLRRVAQEVGLDLERFEQDRGAQSTMARVKSDIELGTRLTIGGTPTVFINGRRAKRISSEALEILINKEIESTTR